MKEVELRAVGENDTYQMLSEFLYQLSMGQGWFQFPKSHKLPGGKPIQDRDGRCSLKPKTKMSLLKKRPLKDYNDVK